MSQATPVEVLAFAPDGTRTSRGHLSPSSSQYCCEEGQTYVFRCTAGFRGSLYVDDAPLRRTDDPDGTCYAWKPELYAGEVEVTVVSDIGEAVYRVDVSPDAGKLGRDIFHEMVADLRRSRPGLLLGDSPARGSLDQQGGIVDSALLLRYERLRRHGPSFLAALRRVAKAPHQEPIPVRSLIPIHAARHVLVSSLAEPRLVATLQRARQGGAQPQLEDELRLVALVHEPTVDTPANRAIKAIAQRFQAAAKNCMEALERKNGEHENGAYFLERWPRRQATLRSLLLDTARLLKSEPFRSVTRAEVSAAGLVQVSASPDYALVYREGKSALGLGIAGLSSDEEHWIRPSWGIYEAWSLLRVLQMIAPHLEGGIDERTDGPVSADLSFSGTCRVSGNAVWVFYQSLFPAERPSASRLGYSLSRERLPDIVIAMKGTDGWRFLVLDAKYRQSRQSTLEAMESAHIYHDSLRLGPNRPDYCLLMLPGSGSTPWLFSRDFWETHAVGAIPDLSKGNGGEGVLDEFLLAWLRKASQGRT